LKKLATNWAANSWKRKRGGRKRSAPKEHHKKKKKKKKRPLAKFWRPALTNGEWASKAKRGTKETGAVGKWAPQLARKQQPTLPLRKRSRQGGVLFSEQKSIPQV